MKTNQILQSKSEELLENKSFLFHFLGNDIEMNIRSNELFVCITEAMKYFNSIRSIKGYANVRIDDKLSSYTTENVISDIVFRMGLKKTNSIKTISDLREIGLAYRIGKGYGQKWFVHYKIFIAIFSMMDDSIKNNIISIAINNIDPFLILNSISKIKEFKSKDENLKTYIALDKVCDICKIGKTTDLRKRLSSLKTSNKDIEYLFVIEKDIEKEMHEILKDFRIEGEWFDIGKSNISKIAKKYGFKKFTGF